MASSWPDKMFLDLSKRGVRREYKNYLKELGEITTFTSTYGIKKSGEQCWMKVKKLRQEYKKMKLVKEDPSGNFMTN